MSTRRGLTGLLVAMILLVALGLRIGYVQETPYKAINDAGTYNRLASMVARHGDYHTGSAPGTGAGGSRGPTAYFPPAYPYLLGLVDTIDGHQTGHRPALHGERIAGAVIGTIAVGVLGLVALEAFGPVTALIAMALAAVYPVLIELSGTLVAENLLVPIELAAVWAALRARRASKPLPWVAAAGILAGLATLAHENAALLLVPLAVVAASASRGRAGGRLGGLAVLAAAMAATIVPWTVRNAVELHHFIPVSDETGITLRGTYNPASAASRPLPYKWRYYIKIPQDMTLSQHAGRYTEIALSDMLQSRAEHYVAAHVSAPLTVSWTNLRRMFEVQSSYAWHAGALAIGLSVHDARIGVASFWVLCVLALAGLLTPGFREGPKWLWAYPVLYALSIVFINVETPRFREPIDPFLLLLAACTISAALERARTVRAARRPVYWRGRTTPGRASG